jgi:hypothetical protein
MGVGKQVVITSALGGSWPGLASALLVLQYDVHPFGLSFGRSQLIWAASAA